MLMRIRALQRICLAAAVVLVSSQATQAAETLLLQDSWQLQTSAKVQEPGERLASTEFDAAGWYPITVPTTVLAALADNGVVPDPYYGDNLTRIPGYKADRWLAMPADSPFRVSWWFRTEFTVPSSFSGKNLVLHLDGINYQANVWLNGTKLADSADVIGMFRRFEFPVNEHLRLDGPNALAIEILGPGRLEDKPYRTKQLEATTGWDDHNPQPPDLNMGIWRKVYLSATGPVALKHPYIATDLDLPSLDVAHIHVSVDAVNTSDKSVTVAFTGMIREHQSDPNEAAQSPGDTLSQEVTLVPGETKRVVFPTVDKSNPKLWWPHPLGPQNLHMLTLEAQVEGVPSDEISQRFGIREATTYINDEGWRGYQVNGKNVLIRGGAWMTVDMLLRLDKARYDGLIRYAREANLNMLRSEGFSIRETEEFYDLCDEYGVMVTQQIFGRSIPDEALAIACIRDMLLRIRNHPSLVHFLGHDETFPTPMLDKAYKDMIAALTPERTYQPHSGAFDVKERFETGGTRTGTRELWTYADPLKYYIAKDDGAWGFAQSGGIGGIFAQASSIRRMMPEEALWPPTNPTWSLHTVIQGTRFFDVTLKALATRYGEAKDFDDLIRKGELLNYESARGMFEAYGRNKYSALGITTWKYDVAWPAALTWHYVDWYLQPTAAYFGAQKACEAVHAQYSYDDHSVWVVNSLLEDFKGLKVTARVFNLDMSEQYHKSATVDVAADGKAKAFIVERPEGLTKTHFLRLDLEDSSGTVLTTNTYWLSTVPDVPGEMVDSWENFSVTPRSTADYTDLGRLETVTPEVKSIIEEGVGENTCKVTLTNTSPHLAFFLNIGLVNEQEHADITPVFWTENFVSLLPGESKTLEGRFYTARVSSGKPVVRVQGWNVPPIFVSPN